MASAAPRFAALGSLSELDLLPSQRIFLKTSKNKTMIYIYIYTQYNTIYIYILDYYIINDIISYYIYPDSGIHILPVAPLYPSFLFGKVSS